METGRQGPGRPEQDHTQCSVLTVLSVVFGLSVCIYVPQFAAVLGDSILCSSVKFLLTNICI